MLRPLPVHTKLYDGESVQSYARRLSARNGTTRQKIEAVLRDDGHLPTRSTDHHPTLLQAWRELGALHATAFTIPENMTWDEMVERRLCIRCTRGQSAWGHQPSTGLICLRHHRLIGPPWTDVGHLKPMLAAEHSFRNVIAARGFTVNSLAIQFSMEVASQRWSKHALRAMSAITKSNDQTVLTYQDTVTLASHITTPALLDSLRDQTDRTDPWKLRQPQGKVISDAEYHSLRQTVHTLIGTATQTTRLKELGTTLLDAVLEPQG